MSATSTVTSDGTAAAAETPAGGFERFRAEFAGAWRLIPGKGLFFALLLAWLALFHFFGNSTLGYKNTSSLFGWLDYVLSVKDDDHHGPLIPFLVLLLLWGRRKELLAVPKAPWWPALALLGLALGLHALGFMVQQTRLSVVAFFVGFYALLGLAWGWAWMRATFFPVFLFSFCLPLGGTLADSMTLPLRILATKIAVFGCNSILGIAVVQDGTRMFDRGLSYTYEVAPACSGIRSLTATLAMAIIYSFVMFRSPWRRVAMIGATIPLTILANVLRLSSIVIGAEVGGQATGDFVHENAIISLLPYVPTIGGILLIGHWLRERPMSDPLANWSNRDLIPPVLVLGMAFFLRHQIAPLKEWTGAHLYTTALLALAALLGWLAWIGRRSATEPEGSPWPQWRRAAVSFALVLALLGATAGFLVHRQANQRLGTPGVKLVAAPIFAADGRQVGTNLVALPESVLNFTSKVVPIDTNVVDWLPRDTTYGQRDYKAPDGFEARMNVVLMGTDRTSIHQPQYCLTGSGWKIEETAASLAVSRPHPYQLPVRKILASHDWTSPAGEKGIVRGVYVYWFVADGQVTAEHGQRMWSVARQMIRTGVLQRWAYVSCFSTCPPGQEEATYERMKELIVAAVPEFQLATAQPAPARAP